MVQASDKLSPFNTDAEESTLGSLLMDSEAMLRVSLLVKPEDFYRDQNRWVFEACTACYERSEAINLVTVAHELERKGRIEECGGAAYLGHLVSIVPTSLHADYYAGIVHELSIKRQLIQVSGAIAALGFGETNSNDAIGKAEELIYGLREHQNNKDLKHIRTILDGVTTELTLAPSEGKSVKVPTGYGDLDNIIGGLHGSDLIILAARPSFGKSSLLLNIAEHAAMKSNANVAIFSLEMSDEQLVQRLIASMAGIDLQRVRQERLSDGESHRIMDTIGRLSEAPIWIDGTAGQHHSDIKAKCKRMANQYGLDAVLIDYLGLVKGTSRDRVQEVAEICHSLKGLAKDLNVPVLIAAQLNRSVEARTPHIPILSDLRESGDIEQDADLVLFIYPEYRYITADEWRIKHPVEPYPHGIAKIIVAKHRNGPIGECSLIFREQLTRFDSLTQRNETEGYWQRD